MMHSKPLAWIAAASLCSPAVAVQISAPPIPSALPGVSQISLANAAGVLEYCERQGLVSGAATDAITQNFADKPDVTSPDYLAGMSGHIIGDGGRKFGIAQAPGYLQSSACNMVFEQAKTFQKR